MSPQPAGEPTPHERRMRGEDRSRNGTSGGDSQWVPPEPVIESPLDNNPDLFANLPAPAVEFETDVFGGVNPFAGARLVDSYGDAVRNFDRRLLASINAPARASQSGPYLQFDQVTVDAGIAAVAESRSPANRLNQWLDDRRMPVPTSFTEDLASVGKYVIGGAELIGGGAYNSAVRIAGGAGSIPYSIGSIERGVGVQEAFTDLYGYTLRSPGAHDIVAALQPVAEFIGNEVLSPLRNESEARIGDAATTTLFAGMQAGTEIGGLLLGSGVLGAVLPRGLSTAATFEGTLYRAVSPGNDPLLIHPKSIAASHRYTAPGEGGLYFSTGEHVVEAETGGSLAGKQLSSFPNKRVPDLLDLSSPAVRNELGVTLPDLVRRGGTEAWRYEITQPLGSWARQNGYSGIIAPSAQASGGLNIIVFDPKVIK